MTGLQSSLDVVIEMLRDLEEFERSGSKETFKKQLREEFVRRSGAANLDEALATTMTSVVPICARRSGKARQLNDDAAAVLMALRAHPPLYAGSPIPAAAFALANPLQLAFAVKIRRGRPLSCLAAHGG